MTVNEILKIVEIAGLDNKDLLELGSKVTELGMTDSVGDLVDVRFPIINKNHVMADNDEWIEKESEVSLCEIEKIVEADEDLYEVLSNSLLDNNDIWEKIGGSYIDDKYLEGIKEGSDAYYHAWRRYGVTRVVKVTNGKDTFYVNTEGYSYARYVGRSAKL